MENKQEILVDKNEGLSSQYVKLQKDVRVYLVITNWRTVKTTKSVKDLQNNVTEKEVVEFRADVKQSGLTPTLLNVESGTKLLSLSNIKFRTKINAMLENKATTEFVRISIKRLNEGVATDYDVEFF